MITLGKEFIYGRWYGEQQSQGLNCYSEGSIADFYHQKSMITISFEP